MVYGMRGVYHTEDCLNGGQICIVSSVESDTSQSRGRESGKSPRRRSKTFLIPRTPYIIRVVEKQLTNLIYEKQKEKLEKSWDIPHPAVLIEAIIEHYEKTGERLLEDWYSRTRSLDSDGYRVYVGYFGEQGLGVSIYWDLYRVDSLGVASVRKLDFTPQELAPFDPLKLTFEYDGKKFGVKEIEK